MMIIGYSRAPSGITVTDPTDVSGLVAWYDFSDASTLYTTSGFTTNVSSDGDRIGGVTDKSGNGNYLEMPVSSRRTVYKTGIQNSLSISRHNSITTNEFLRTNDGAIQVVDASTGAISIFAVANRTGIVASQAGIVGLDSATLGRVSQLNINTSTDPDVIEANAWKPSEWQSATETYTGSAWKTFTLLSGGASDYIYCYLNGSTSGGTALAATTTAYTTYIGVGIGCNNCGTAAYLRGDIGEIFIYNRAVSAAERSALETYLNDKWAIY